MKEKEKEEHSTFQHSKQESFTVVTVHCIALEQSQCISMGRSRIACEMPSGRCELHRIALH